MSKIDNFITLVNADAICACVARPGAMVRPSAILSVALQCPGSVLKEDGEQLRFQAAELVDWFFGGKEPNWLPEHLLYEEVEELVEQYVTVHQEEEYEYVEPSEIYED